MPKELSGVVSLDLSKQPEPHPQSGSIEAIAKRFEVVDEQSYGEAASLIQNSAAVIARVEAFFEKDKSLAFQLHRSITSKIATLTAPWRTVRPLLESKMKTFRRKQEEERQARERELQRQAAEADRLAREEAARIQQEADQAAAELRKQGHMRVAKEALAAAAQRAQEVVQTAAALADVGVVLPDVRPLDGPGESRPWQAEVTDLKAMCLAIGRGEIPLTIEMPKRGGGSEMVPLIEPNMSALNYLAKRMGREDIGIKGARAFRGLQLKFSSKAAAVQSGAPQEQDGW
jgi:hypothetical protein